MQKMLAAWEEHLAHPALPRTLAARLEKQGLEVRTLERHSIIERSDEGTGYMAMLLGILPGFAPGRCGITKADAEAWHADQLDLRDRRESYLSIGQYFFGAKKRDD